MSVPDCVDSLCEDAMLKYVVCAGLPCNRDKFWPLIPPNQNLSRDVLEYFANLDFNGGDELLPIALSKEVYMRLKAEHKNDPKQECEYCGTATDGDRCGSCGAPKPHAGLLDGFRLFIRKMPRYDFDPVLGFVLRSARDRKWLNAQYECALIIGGRENTAIMYARMAQYVFSASCY